MRRALSLFTIAALVTVAAASAQAATRAVQLSFKRSGTADGVVTNGRYTLIEAGGRAAPTLLDEQSGRRVKLPACATPRPWHGFLSGGFEGPYFEWADCGASVPTLDLYRLSTGARSTMPIGNVAGCDPSFNPCVEEPGPAGTDWYVVDVYSSRCLCTGTFIVSRSTGRTADPVQGPIDLDSPQLARTLCAPLQGSSDAQILTFGGDSGFSGSGVGEVFGEYLYGFQSSGASLGGFAIDPAQPFADYLRRCHSSLRRRLSSEFVTGNRTAVVLYSFGDTHLRGVLLPSLRRFIVPLPALLRTALARDPRTTFALSDRRLWAVTGTHQLWSAPAPR
jgi:hypothetical protein